MSAEGIDDDTRVGFLTQIAARQTASVHAHGLAPGHWPRVGKHVRAHLSRGARLARYANEVRVRSAPVRVRPRRFAANDLVPHQRGARVLRRAQHQVSLVHPHAAVTDVALEEDRHAVVRHPADHPLRRCQKPRPPGVEPERQLRHVGQRGDHAAGWWCGVRLEPGQRLGLDDVAARGRGWGSGHGDGYHLQPRTSGMSSPWARMYSVCSIRFSAMRWRRCAQREPRPGTRSMTS